MTFGPLMMISPCTGSAVIVRSIWIETPGIALPTLPILRVPGQFAVAIGLVSVRP